MPRPLAPAQFLLTVSRDTARAVQRGKPVMSTVTDEMFDLARQVQGCDVRLGLLGTDTRHNDFRRDLERRRAEAAERLAELEAEHGLPPEGDLAEEPDQTASDPA